MISRLRLAVAATVRGRGLWAPGQSVAVAVSGGLDSVCLLDLLVHTRGLHGGRLRVVTVDHGTRPDAADDAELAASLAGEAGLEAVIFRARLGAGASEAACRQARQELFAALPDAVVATAHHRDDQAETALLGWMRGGGTRALSGMAWRSGRVVRPLLDITRAELQAWAAHRHLRWREDPSNDSDRFLRNRVRHELLPLFEQLRPGASAAMARGASLLAADDDLLERLSVEAEQRVGEGWSRAWIAVGESPLVRRAMLRAWPEASAAQLDAIVRAARAGRGAVQLSKAVTVVVDRDTVRTVVHPGVGLAAEGLPDPAASDMDSDS